MRESAMTYSVTISGQTIEVKANSPMSAVARAAGKVYGSVLPHGQTLAVVNGKTVALSNP
jgi:DNA-binding transcriptional regulator LsrR (DeoR family)